MNLTFVISLASAAAGAFLTWQLQAHQITKLELNHANERIAAARATRAALERSTSAVIAAQNAAAGRVAVIRRDADRAAATADGLRDDLDSTQRAAATTIDACNQHSLTLGKLLVEAVALGRELAQAADGHASDVRTLTESWPK